MCLRQTQPTKFDAKWILNSSFSFLFFFFGLVKNVSSSQIKGSHAYQLTRKSHLLKQEIKHWPKTQIFELKKEMNKKGSRKLSISINARPLDKHLWL